MTLRAIVREAVIKAHATETAYGLRVQLRLKAVGVVALSQNAAW